MTMHAYTVATRQSDGTKGLFKVDNVESHEQARELATEAMPGAVVLVGVAPRPTTKEIPA